MVRRCHGFETFQATNQQTGHVLYSKKAANNMEKN